MEDCFSLAEALPCVASMMGFRYKAPTNEKVGVFLFFGSKSKWHNAIELVVNVASES